MLFLSHLLWAHPKNQRINQPILIALLVIEKCPKCGINSRGKRTCCAPDGAWVDECGDPGENKQYTWVNGLEACHPDLLEFDSEAQSMFKRNGNSSTSNPAFAITVDVNVEEKVNTDDCNKDFYIYGPITTILITFLVA